MNAMTAHKIDFDDEQESLSSGSAQELQQFHSNENFAELLEKSGISELKEGSVIKGRVVAIEKDIVIVDIGFKTEGRVPLREFSVQHEEIKVGDQIDLYLEHIENVHGESVVSRERAVREESWFKMEAAFERKQNVDGIIFGRVKGGFTVDLSGAVAFLPGSQVDVRPVKDISPLMGISQPFQILKMDRKRGNIVVSRRAILEESRSAERSEMLSTVEEGAVLDGIVKNITNYGAFVDLGVVDGLLHITDISWKRIAHPSEVLSVGQNIKVKVIKFDQETKRISLGYKQLEGNPWKDIEGRFTLGTKHTGKVTSITDYGAFVELEKGIEGLVHVSEMSWSKKNVNPGKVVTLGQEIEVMVLEVDPTKHRISLGMKQCQQNPWTDFAAKYPEGSKLTGEIKNVADFGIFVGLEGAVDGLVHVSDLTWEKNPEEVLKQYNKGDSIDVVVLSIEPDKERISLGVKQLQAGAIEGVLEKFKKGEISTFTVKAVNEEGIEVQVAEGITSFIKKADLSKDRVERRPERFAIGDRVDAKIIAVNNSTGKISLSIKALEIDEQKKAIEEYGSADSGASLGDILGIALGSAKEKEKEKKAKAAKKQEAQEEAKEKRAASKKKDAKKSKDSEKEDE